MSTTRHDLVDRAALDAMGRVVATSFICDECRKKRPIEELNKRVSSRFLPRCTTCHPKAPPKWPGSIRIWKPEKERTSVSTPERTGNIAAVDKRISEVGGRAWNEAQRKALVNGEFDDPCDHGEQLPVCTETECQSDFLTIMDTYLGAREVSA